MRPSLNSHGITDYGTARSGTAAARGLAAVAAALLLAMAGGPAHAASFPPASAWVDQGVMLQPGPAGSWDVLLYGAISPSTAIKKGDTYYLYYIGADGTRSSDGGPRHRALGVATSTDGISFTKYAGNPIITYLPHNNEEEGLFSAAATLDDSGNIVLYYSACIATSATATLVNCDGRVATSGDGLAFTDEGIVIDHADSGVWNAGDELFPVGAFRDAGKWYVYYIGKGNAGSWLLGLASGSAYNALTSTQRVLSQGSSVTIHGGGNAVGLAGGQFTVPILRSTSNDTVYVSTASTSSPQTLSAATAYNFGNNHQFTVLYDASTSTWFMYHQVAGDLNTYRVKTAPGGTADATPPGVPTGVVVRLCGATC